MPDLLPISREDKIKCIQREINFRITVYKRRIETGTMTVEKAEREMDIMRAILSDYHRGTIE